MFDDIDPIQPQADQQAGTPPANLPVAPISVPEPMVQPAPATGVVDMFSSTDKGSQSAPPPPSAVSVGKIQPKAMPSVPQPQSVKSPKGGRKMILIIGIAVVGIAIIIGGAMAVLSMMKQPTLEDLPSFDSQSIIPADSIPATETESESDVQPTQENDTTTSNLDALSPDDQLQDTPQEQLPQDQPVVIDTDGDGLTDQDEVQYNTNQFFPDTDFDGLTDREEVQIYSTDPLSKDTDGDGFDDGQEVRNGYNPKGPGKSAQ
ncbi:MAG: hypothetical protein A3B94_01690 [Candidatus Jacksonbacteria bacterium RIFCSPHIGHO2_02_FULL_43_10]|nr:MAG: hypothetical protein A3B94_01690 [Candidatus Jacksonbacteria bacterium RIFCSPHIGHO2_02_FULL_43_10]